MSNTYAEAREIDLNRVLDLLLNYSVGRGRDLNLVLQIFDRDFDQVIEGARLMGMELNDRAPRMTQSPAQPKITKKASYADAEEKTASKSK